MEARISTFSAILATLLLISPGFVAVLVWRLIIGVRSSEFQSTAVWGVTFSVLTYIALFAAAPHWPWLAGTLGALGAVDLNSRNDLTFAEAIRVAGVVYLLDIVLAVLAGWLARARWVRALVQSIIGRGYSPDPWINLITGLGVRRPSVLVRLKDGRHYLGRLREAGELTARTLVLTDAVMYDKDDADLSGPIGLLGDKSELLIADGIESVQIVADEVLAAVWAAAPDPDDTNVGPVDEAPADGPGDH